MNTATLAVAGSRKTQSIIDACISGPSEVRRLAISFTLNGQQDLQRRLNLSCKAQQIPDVIGWYAFLMRHFIRPYLPVVYGGRRLRGLNFDGEPALGIYASGESRFLDAEGRAYKLHLSKLAFDVAQGSDGAVTDRLRRIYDEIYIDEVQDLTGYDLDILELLLKSGIDVHMVGDIRQSVYDTNPRDPRLPQFRGLAMARWFEIQEQAGRLTIAHSVKTWRSNQAIATFSDQVLPASYGFPSTESEFEESTDHDGVFVVSDANAPAYIATFEPRCLRSTVSTPVNHDVQLTNFGLAKGLTFDRVLIFPTGPIVRFLKSGTALAPKSSCGLYVAVTRARHSVAFVVPDPSLISSIDEWLPA